MIVALKIRNYKGIRSTPELDLSNFHVLVGPNGSGKSTFLDAIEFVKDCLTEGPRSAVDRRAPDFRDLTFMRRGGEIAIDLWLDLSALLPEEKGKNLHYRLAIVADKDLGVRVSEETLERTGKPKGVRLVGKTASGKDYYRRESGTYQDVFVFGPNKLALSLTPPDETRYPAGNAVKAFLMEGIRFIQLDSPAMRRPSPATSPAELQVDGANLARTVGMLKRSGSDALDEWVNHLRYAIEDLKSIGWAARQADNAEYLVLKYDSGLECPSWLLSDGTLRMLALTLPAFLPARPRIYMIEEPENGVHPKALELIVGALMAIPQAQVFVATHSPLVVQEAGAGPLLCFRKDDSGVHVVRGLKHSALKNWKGVPELSSIFASRVLG